MTVLQLSAVLELIPPWLPTVTVAAGMLLILVGASHRYLAAYASHHPGYSYERGVLLAITSAATIAGATYVSVRRYDFVLLFVLLIFVSGRIIQGAIAARIVQKVLDFLDGDGRSDQPMVQRTSQYITDKIRDRITIALASGIIVAYTTISITAAFVLEGAGSEAAIRRFWVGFFLLTVTGLVFDFRYFAHRIPWTAAFGLVVATAGAFLYDPVGFSSVTGAISPYLNSPIPDWARAPIGAFGFLAGVLFWSIFYRKSS